MLTTKIVFLGLAASGLFFTQFCQKKEDKSYEVVPGTSRESSLALFWCLAAFAVRTNNDSLISFLTRQTRYLLWHGLKWISALVSTVMLIIGIFI